MEEAKPVKGNRNSKANWFITVFLPILCVIILIAMFFAIRVPHHPPERDWGIKSLASSISMYASDHDNKYPTPNKWCDLLVSYGAKEYFKCSRDKKGPCSYAINPNVEPNSPHDVVLLFEAKSGWNRSGGPELLNFENNDGKGCAVLFNDYHMEFIEPNQVSKLKWK